MKTIKLTLASLFILSLTAVSCSPDTADVQENNNSENVSDTETFSPNTNTSKVGFPYR